MSGSFIVVPEHETYASFNPTQESPREHQRWTTLGDSRTPLSSQHPSAEDVLTGITEFDIKTLVYDPEHFRAGQLHNHMQSWDTVIDGSGIDCADKIRSWLCNGVGVHDFFITSKAILRVEPMIQTCLLVTIFLMSVFVKILVLLYTTSYLKE